MSAPLLSKRFFYMSFFNIRYRMASKSDWNSTRKPHFRQKATSSLLLGTILALGFVLIFLHSTISIPIVVALPVESVVDTHLLGRDGNLVGLPAASASTTTYNPSPPELLRRNAPDTVGSIHVPLETAGRSSAPPFNPSHIPVPSSAISVPSTAKPLQPAFASPTADLRLQANIFVSIAHGNPPSQVSRRADHPASQLGIKRQNSPIHTNKFYANFFLGTQHQPVWTHPYSLQWADGSGNLVSYGMSVSHIERRQVAYGPGDPAQYFINPIGIRSIILSAVGLGPSTVLTTSTLQSFSIDAQLAPSAGARPLITFPIVQGMGFVTAVYTNAAVLIQSGVFFNTINYVENIQQSGTYKYDITLLDGTAWLMYVIPAIPSGPPSFVLKDSTAITGPTGFTGTIQIAKNTVGVAGESFYDRSAGVYAVSATISGFVEQRGGTYTLSWKKGGQTDRTLIMFALPHHVETMDVATRNQLTPIQLQTTTKGLAVGVMCDSMTLFEDDLPVDIGFDPWSPTLGSVGHVSDKAAAAIASAAAIELNQNIAQQSDLNSMYYSGKALSKFATLIYATSQLGRNASLATAGLTKLKSAFAEFAENRQIYPLVYDLLWRGLVSSSTYLTKDPNMDFGNSMYNDHHFHYGYFVHAAAVIAYLDPAWLAEGTNKAWVNALVRDYANGVEDDAFFPFSRCFDWFHGHSWAKGLFESGDGKDEESSSEDAFSLYAVKMWGKVVGDANMEARGNLQLAVLARSLRHYFLMTSDNTVEPPRFIGNKVSGILFENKIDHTTYFGTNAAYIEGIHMLPISPISGYTRSRAFVQQEWDAYFGADGAAVAHAAPDGWRGILFANLAIIDARASYGFFADPGFAYAALDGGASRTWYLAFAAALGGL